MPVRASKRRMRSPRARASSSVSLTPASGVTAHIGARPVTRACSSTASRTSSSGCAASMGMSAPPHVGARAARSRGRGAPSGSSRASRRMPVGQPGGAHGDGARVDGQRAGIAHHADGLDDAVDVRQRLAHPLEDDAVHALARRSSVPRTRRTCSTISHVSRLRARPSRPVAQKAHASAQPACELTQALKRPGALERDAHRLDDVPVGVASASFTNGSRRAAAHAHAARATGTCPRRSHARRARRAARPAAVSTGSPAVHRRDDLARLGRLEPEGARRARPE